MIPPRVRNTLAVVLISSGMIASFFYLERAFRTGDSRRAIQAVQQTRQTPGGPTVLEEMLREFGPQAEIHWIGQTEDNFRGVILVTAELPDRQIKRWHVDLIHGTVSELD